MLRANSVIVVCWLIFLSYWIINWHAVKQTEQTEWKAPGFYWTSIWIIILLFLLSHFLHPLHQNLMTSTSHIAAIQTVGIVITVIGLIIAIIARRSLADNWSSDVALKKDHKLITTGIYRYIRHPIYTGVTFMGIGTILVLQSIVIILFYVIMVVFLLYKYKKEEKLLRKHFPKAYATYMKKTKALIPFIY
jgi:protein-S-isoprenylcysteine O-methyltransferase Ste14